MAAKRLNAVLWASVVSMFVVLLMGALVTKTGSADGCGDTWPLCDGQLLPAWQTSSLIEFGHRLVSGLTGILIIVMAVATWRVHKDRLEIRWLVPAAVFFLLLQAWLGAMAVMWPQPKTVLALHFGISLIAFAAVLLPAILVRQMRHGVSYRHRRVTDGLRRFVWFVTAYIYVIVYTGAYVKHTGSDLACVDFPLCNGQLFPTMSGAVGIHYTHRLAAYAGIVLLAVLVARTRRVKAERPDLYRGAVFGLAAIVLQAASGALTIVTQLSLLSMMMHSGIVTVLFGILSYLSMQVFPEPRSVAAKKPAHHEAFVSQGG